MAGEDDDDKALFMQLLREGGKEWLTEALKEMGLEAKPPTNPQDPPKPPADFASFLADKLGLAEKRNEKLQDRLDEILEILTPEQRTQLRSRRSAGEADPPTSKKQSATGSDPRRKPGFLRSL